MATPDFKYAPMFQLGPDTTEYRLLSTEGVSTGEFEGKYYSHRSLWKISCLDIEILVDNPECVHLLT